MAAGDDRSGGRGGNVLSGRNGPTRARVLLTLWLAVLFWLMHPLSVRYAALSVDGVGSFFGRCSYSIYLMHIPLWPLGEMVARNGAPGLPEHWAAPLITAPLVWLLGYSWHLYFEKPGSLPGTGRALRHPWRTLREGYDIRTDFRIKSS